MSTGPNDTTILVVEDDADVRDTMVQVLESEGFSVRAARDGREALDVLHAGVRPKLILLDLMMPVMNGWQVREALQQERDLASIPVVFVTAMDPSRVTPKPEAFLHKPFELTALLEAVEHATAS